MNKTMPVLLLVGLFLSVPSFAGSIYQETIDGELSGDNLNPSVLSFSPGNNIVSGSMGRAATLDRDFFTFTLAPGQSLTNLWLDFYQSTENLSFLAIQAGSVVTSLTNGSALLGAALVGTGPGKQVGDNLLDDLGAAIVAGTGFSGALNSGTYTIWFQETAAPVNYSLNLEVSEVPLPGSAWLLASGLFILAARARRRK